MSPDRPLQDARSTRMGDFDRPIRVVYVTRAPFVSGAERALLTILRGLHGQGVDAHVVVGTDGEFVSLAQSIGVPVHVIPLPQPGVRTAWNWWQTLRRFRRLLKDVRPDLIHANEVPACQAASMLAAELDIPLLLHIRWHLPANELAWWVRGRADAILCISHWVREQLGDLGPTPLAEIPVTVHADPITWNSDDHEILPPPTDESIVLGFAGQIIPAKGIDLLIDAVAKIPHDRRPKIRIAGKDTQSGGEYLRELQARAIQQGVADRFEWLGFVNSIEELYRTVDAVVCPSRVEPLGLVPLEAARYGRPALVSAVGGFCETVQHEQTGYQAPPTVEGWTRLLSQLPSRNLVAQLGRQAHDWIGQEFAWSVYREALIAQYDELKSQRSKSAAILRIR